MKKLKIYIYIYILNNCAEIEDYLKEQMLELEKESFDNISKGNKNSFQHGLKNV